MKKVNNLMFWALAFVLLQACQKATPTEPPYPITKSLTADSAMVASAHPEASRIGMEILKKGGNAVDAAIATQLALAVVYPVAGNIGGGGFMVFRKNDGEVLTLDYREKAPAAATRDMYLDSAGNPVDEWSRNGHLAVGVPGTVAGLLQSHKYGVLPFEDLINPAIELAENGYYMTKREADNHNRNKDRFLKYNKTRPPFVKKEGEWKEGDLIVNKDLAEVLKRIRDNGKEGFYGGKTAALIVKEMESGGGIITLEDLASYNAVWRTPVTFEYKNYTIHSMPPPSSGGVALAQLLGCVEQFPLSDWGFHDVKSVHAMVEAERRVYADRATHLGDMDYYPVPIEQLIDKNYLAQRMANFNAQQATSSDSVVAGEIATIKESEQTTHLSVVDAEGNAVSVTTTLNSGFGSKVVVADGGFFLNNEMDDFSAKPGTMNQFGLIGAEANAIEPGKRMLSSMTPTIIEKDGKLFMVVGTPGGSTIITSVFQVFLNVAEFGMSMNDAVQENRFHHQWLPEKVFIEEGTFSEETIKQLTEMGHTIEVRGNIGRVEGILITADGSIEGAADRRGDDDVRGF